MRGGLPRHLAASVGGGFAAVALDGSGGVQWLRELDFRAHDVVAHPPSAACAIIGRKPGPRALLCDLGTGAPRLSLDPLPDCTFDGHAVFSGDGATLYATQSKGPSQSGMIAAYRTATGACLGSFPSHGTEPHELLWRGRGAELVIANGGIVDRHGTDPIRSTLTVVDAVDGSLLQEIALDEEYETLSVRHLARLGDGAVAFAMQDQDPATGPRPVAGILGVDGVATFLELPRDMARRMGGYAGSIATDAGGGFICATSPRGGLAVFWDRAGTFCGGIDMADVCGVAASGYGDGFLLSSGHGALRQAAIDGATCSLFAAEPAQALFQWDNHLSVVDESARAS